MLRLRLTHPKFGYCPIDKANYDWTYLLGRYRKYVTKDSVVLELGASTVAMTRELARYCKEVIGVEIDPDRKPSDFGNVRYLLGDWQRLTEVAAPESVDIAFASHVLEHVADDLKALDELYAVLKPGGIGLLSTPNRHRAARLLAEAVHGKKPFPDGEHCREYVEEDLLAVLRKSHFQKYKITPVVFGIHGGPLFLFSENVPNPLRRLAGYWIIELFKG